MRSLSLGFCGLGLLFVGSAAAESPDEKMARSGSSSAGSDVELTYDLNAPESHGDGAIEVAETIRPTTDGWERAVRVARPGPRLPSGLRPALAIQSPDLASDRSASTLTWKVGTDRATLTVNGADPLTSIPGDDPGARLFVLDPGAAAARVRLSVQPQD